MNIIGFIAQIFSIAAMLIAVLSFQCKNNRNFCLWQATASGFFSLSFLILGGYSGAATNAINILRGTSFGLVNKKYRNFFCILLPILYTIGTIFTYSGFMSLILLLAQVVGTVSIWYNNGKIMRIIQFFWISPIWLAYSIYYFSLGGIICECFTLVSVLVSFIRYGFDGFEK